MVRLSCERRRRTLSTPRQLRCRGGEERRETRNFEARHQFVGQRGRILPRIGNQALKLLPRVSFGHWLPDHALISRRTNRDICAVASQPHEGARG